MSAADDDDGIEDEGDLADECTLFALALLARACGATTPQQLMELAESGALQSEFPKLTRKLPPAEAAKLLAYRARMEEDPAEADELIKAALSLDTECIEARVFEALQLDDDPQESVRRLRDAVALARRPFLSTDTGIVRETLRGLHDATRRRALLALAAAEQENEAFADAAGTYQELERSFEHGDPDWTRARTMRLVCWLTAGDVAQARSLLKGDDAQQQPWGLALERFLSDDMDGARAALERARATSPRVEKLFRGDEEFEDYAGAQGPDLDALALGSLVLAWRRHDGAQQWLRSQKRRR
jgi:hypothetical protein